MIGHLELAVADGDLLAGGDLHATCMLPPQGAGAARTVRFPIERGRVPRRAYESAFSAEPALNQPICSSVRLWRALDRDGPAVGLVDPDLDRLARREGLARPAHAHAVRLLEQVVVLRVRERQGQDPLLLQVRLVDAREALAR